jgi:hypothetical protein
MPADCRSDRIFSDQYVRQFLGRQAGDPRRGISKREKKDRHFRRRLQLALREIVVMPERDDAAFASIALKLKLLKW